MTESDWGNMTAPLDDPSSWSIVHSRFRDTLDMLVQIAPEEPFVQEMAATRARVQRRYEEIKASMPEGLTTQERGEYIAAQALASIYPEDTTKTAGVPSAEG